MMAVHKAFPIFFPYRSYFSTVLSNQSVSEMCTESWALDCDYSTTEISIAHKYRCVHTEENPLCLLGSHADGKSMLLTRLGWLKGTPQVYVLSDVDIVLYPHTHLLLKSYVMTHINSGAVQPQVL